MIGDANASAGPVFPVSSCLAHLRATDEDIWLQESRLLCLCWRFRGSSCRRARPVGYLSSAHLQQARLKHLSGFISRQGVRGGV